MSNTIKIHDYWCKQQEEDYMQLMQAVDSVGAASLALATTGAQAYGQFIEARDDFKEVFTAMSKRYRYVEITN